MVLNITLYYNRKIRTNKTNLASKGKLQDFKLHIILQQENKKK